MSLLHKHHAPLQAMSPSSTSPTSFAAVDAYGNVSLWDVRLKQPNYLEMDSSILHNTESVFTDIVCYSHCDKVVVINDCDLEVFDVRMSLSSFATYHHSCDLVATYYGSNTSYCNRLLPKTLRHALVVDEEGKIVSIDVTSGLASREIDSCIFGNDVDLNKNKETKNYVDVSISNISNININNSDESVTEVPAFGKLNNLCSTIGVVYASETLPELKQRNANNVNNTETNLLFVIDMSGHGVLYDSNLSEFPFTLCNALNYDVSNNDNNNDDSNNDNNNINNREIKNVVLNDNSHDEILTDHSIEKEEEEELENIKNGEIEKQRANTASPSSSSITKLFNPPLVNCCAFCDTDFLTRENKCSSENATDALIALGRADGTYDVLSVDFEHKSIVELMSAPAHACNGVVYTSWVRDGILLTTSLCGEISIWNVKQFLTTTSNEWQEKQEQHEDEENKCCYHVEEEIDELPQLLDAYSHREIVPSKFSQINACTRLGNLSYLIADTLGNITTFTPTL